MAFTRVLYTSLAVWGGPGPASAPLVESGTVTDTLSVSLTDTSVVDVLNALSVTDTLSVSLTETVNLASSDLNLYRTQLRVFGPGPYIDIGDKTSVSIAELNVSDTLAVQILEEPVDDQQIITADTLRLSITDISVLFNNIAVTDPLRVALSETVALIIAGVVDKPVTDTLSVALTEASALNVTLETTDTLSVSLTDTSAVSTPVEVITVTDSLSVSVNEVAVLQIFAGTVELTVGDELAVTVTETTSLVRTTPTEPGGSVKSIRFELRGPSMRFEFL